MFAQNFNIASKSPSLKMWDLQPKILYFGQKYSEKENLSTG